MTQDIINDTKSKAFDFAFEEIKHHVTLDEVDTLFDYCKATASQFELFNIL